MDLPVTPVLPSTVEGKTRTQDFDFIRKDSESGERPVDDCPCQLGVSRTWSYDLITPITFRSLFVFLRINPCLTTDILFVYLDVESLQESPTLNRVPTHGTFNL